jgi:hypothetical protein
LVWDANRYIYGEEKTKKKKKNSIEFIQNLYLKQFLAKNIHIFASMIVTLNETDVVYIIFP